MPAAAPPVRLQYSDVGIDVPIEGMEIADGVVDPPTLNGVYYIRNRGLPGEGSTGTTYLAGHGWQGGNPPFNGLSDTFGGNRGAKPGDKFMLTLEADGQLSCEVEQVLAISKDELFNNPQHEVWRKVANRVVLLSCYIAEDDGVTRNVDVIARCGAA